MKTMKTTCLAIAIMLMGMSMTSCQKLIGGIVDAALKETMNHEYEDSEKWGKVVTNNLDLTDFDHVDMKGAVRLEYTQDSLCMVQAYGNEKAIEAYDIEVKNGELRAYLKNGSTSISKKTPRITLRVTSPLLKKAECSGAAQMVVNGIAQDEDLRLVATGASDITLDSCAVNDMEVRISGAGDMKLQSVKAAGDVDLQISGAGDLKGNLACQNLKIKVAGAGDGDLDVECGDVDVTVSGAADMKLSGSCNHYDMSQSGSGSLDTKLLKVKE